MTVFTRRNVLGSAVSTAIAGMTTPSRAQRAETMRLGMGAAQVITIDPIFLNQGVDNWAITHVFDFLARAPLGRFGQSPADFTSELAQSWTISPDSRVWTFHLRKGVQFHKGYGELTSEDVAFTFDRGARSEAGIGSHDKLRERGHGRGDGSIHGCHHAQAARSVFDVEPHTRDLLQHRLQESGP